MNLSPLAAALQGALSDSPDRTAYLERLSADFATGNYNPNPNDIASGIVSDTLLDATAPPEQSDPKK